MNKKDDLDQYIKDRKKIDENFKKIIKNKELIDWPEYEILNDKDRSFFGKNLRHPLEETSFKKTILNSSRYVKKGWGYKLKHFFSAGSKVLSNIGEVFVYHKPDHQEILTPETVKILYIDKNKTLSTHFHVKKTEIFYCVHGCFKITLISDGETKTFRFNQGQSMLIRPGMVHAIAGLDDKNILLEVSTLDTPEDSYRIKKGD